jgi:DNA excision repair protein ERCC-2
MKKLIRVSVRAFVEHLLRQGDLSSVFDFGSRTSGYNGLRAHQKIQKSRPDPYHSEVPVFYRIDNESLTLNIQGRIDGVYRQNGSVVIEEIKTTRRDLDNFIAEQNPLHWAQVKTYAAIYSLENDIENIQTQLTYCQLETGEIKTFSEEISSDELNLFFLDLASQYLDWMERIEHWQSARDKAILNASFPFSSFRLGQSEMVEEVSKTIQNDGQIIIQAPTGTGKTIAALYPAVKSLALGHVEKVFYLTARSTGRVIAEKTLMELNQRGLNIKFVTITAKEKICFNPDKNCTSEECPFAKGYYNRLVEARESLFKKDEFTRETILEIAEFYEICPFEFSLDMSLWVDCVICDVNYAFDPRVYLRRFFLENSLNGTFLIDEAHNLVDRSREMFSAQIDKASFLELRQKLDNKKSEIYKLAGEINSTLLEKKQAHGEDVYAWEQDRPEDLLPLLKNLVLSLERKVTANPQSPLNPFLLDHYFEVNWFCKVAEMYNENYVTCLEKKGRDLTVKLFCVDPSEQLSAALERANSAVLFSATITPMSYFARMLGCREDVQKRILPSPFPPENLCVLASKSVSTLYRHRSHTKHDLAKTIGSLVSAKRGNYLVFFPSYAYMDMVFPLYEQLFPHHTMRIQTQGMSEDERLMFLEYFSHENSSTLVGFAVMGGIFGEGIDLVGDRLSGAVIVGVGLPGISLERELIRVHFEDKEMPGFNYSYLYPGMNRVFQAAGRVIRSEEDRGAILLVDTRYSLPQYNSLFPSDWQVRFVQNEKQVSHILDKFWKGQSLMEDEQRYLDQENDE